MSEWGEVSPGETIDHLDMLGAGIKPNLDFLRRKLYTAFDVPFEPYVPKLATPARYIDDDINLVIGEHPIIIPNPNEYRETRKRIVSDVVLVWNGRKFKKIVNTKCMLEMVTVNRNAIVITTAVF
jgi:hypothetical protein